MGGNRRPRGGKVASTGTPRAPGGRVEATQVPGSRAKTTSPLSSRYEFIPAANTPPPPSKRPFMPSTSTTAHVKDYPPPTSLFQNPDQRNSLSEPRNSGALARNSQPLPRNSQPHPHTSSPPTPRSSHHSDEHQSPSFQAQNSIGDAAHSDGEAHSGDERVLCTASLSEDQLRILTALLTKPGREEYTTVLSSTPKPGTTWFGRDKSSLTRKITKIFTNKFDGPYYSWTCVPRDRQERYFVEFAKTHTWDPLITGLVQEKFEAVCKRRMKDMVSTVRTSRERPRWIEDTLWTKMVQYWDTEEAKEKSSTTSAARMSERGGLGPHVHLSGQKSYLQVEEEMVVELGRPVSLGEVFIRTHTKPDGTFVDRKAETVAQTFTRNKQARESELATQSSLTSDGRTGPQKLSIEEENKLFLQSTYVNERGVAYGVGSLSEQVLNGKRKYGSESSYRSLQDQLEEAQRQIGEQAAANKRLEAEHAKVSTEQQKKIDQLSLVEKYLMKTDPAYLDFLAANENHSTEQTSPQNSNH